ncbi:MAG: CrcB family protein [Opitutaceae bacterium]|nr:CrcB family protein [Cytophagales bacterium]
MEVIFVALGAALGGVSRWVVNKLLLTYQPFFPFSTLAVNVASSFLVGIFISIILLKQPGNIFIKPLLITGFCGGFSTMSSLSLESFQLFTQGKIFIGVLNFTLNILLCLLATWAGISITKSSVL